MALRLPLLAMMICSALVVAQRLQAQQFFAPQQRATNQNQDGLSASSDNPLRNGIQAVSGDTHVAPIVFSANEHSTIAMNEKQTSSGNAIPREILDVLYPPRETKSSNQDQTNSVNTIEQAAHFEAASAIANQPEAVSIETPGQFATSDRLKTNNELEPTRTEMAADFSRLPKPVIDVDSQLPAEPIVNQNQVTVASLLTSSSSGLSFGSVSTGGKKLAGGKTDSELATENQFQQLLQNIATSTCLVIILGVGFILVAKRFVAAKPTGGKQSMATAPRISVVANLKLTPKSRLHLIEVGDQRVLVASDVTGIKSVVSLNQSFSTALNSLDEMESAASVPSQTYGQTQPSKQSAAEIEAEMQRKLSEILGGEAFKDVFYKSTRAMA